MGFIFTVFFIVVIIGFVNLDNAYKENRRLEEENQKLLKERLYK